MYPHLLGSGYHVPKLKDTQEHFKRFVTKVRYVTPIKEILTHHFKTK
jgi:hypothetical protein